MWRIYYYPDTGRIKYQINIESASQLEPTPFVDFMEQQNIEGKSIDINTKQLVNAPPIPRVEPAFTKPDRVIKREFPFKL